VSDLGRTGPRSGLRITGAHHLGRTVDVRAVDGVIVALGPDLPEVVGDRVLDARGLALLPGLVNGHTHAAMTLLRSFGDDLHLMPWLEERIWPAEARLTDDDVYWATRLAALEMIRSGTVHFVDMYWHATAVGRAAADAGLRATVSQVLIDGGPRAETPRVDALEASASASLDALSDLGPLVTPSLGPHAVYTVSPRSLERLGRLAEDRRVAVHIHVSETSAEVEDCVAATGLRPPELLDRHGLLGPRTVAAHCCWLDDEELDLLATRGVTAVTNPVSNLKLAAGTFPWERAARAGVAVALGTDGTASNNALDLLADTKVLALVHKAASGDPTVLPAEEAWRTATGAASPLLGGARVEVGAPADLVLVDTDRPEMVPGPLLENLVYAASGSVVDSVVVAGAVVMEHGHVEGAAEVLAEVRARAERIRDGA
jgi:5-methylthioadenosine/S-adenosylhomocysteine deaminase